MPRPLPSFASPPVTEVVISSRYKYVPTYSLLTIADLARTAASNGFVVIEERPGYDAPTERFGASVASSQVSLEILSGPPPTRYWFLNPVGDELLQLQPNWVAANWRKVAPTADYGRWDSRWSAFSTWVESVETSLTEGNSELQHDQVEVTYVNHIETKGVWQDHSDASRVFSFLANLDQRTDGFLSEPEQTTTELQFVIPDPTDSSLPLGRLHVAVTPGFKRPTNEPIFLMNLTARGRPTSSDLQGVRAFAELGHEWIVRAFADLTTPEMHLAWERNDTSEGEEA